MIAQLPPPATITCGCAGTGKSTVLAKRAIAAAAAGRNVGVTAFTHAAVKVLTDRLQAVAAELGKQDAAARVDARTIDSLISKPVKETALEKAQKEWDSMDEQAQRRLLAKPNVRGAEDGVRHIAARMSTLTMEERGEALDYEELHLDEASMIPARKWRELAAAMGPAAVHVYGDHAQLPPVGDDPMFLALIEQYPKLVDRLTVNHRASGALNAAFDAARAGEMPAPAPGIVEVGAAFDPARIAAVGRKNGFVLCYTNATRKLVHQRARRAAKRGVLPQAGESVVVHEPGAFYRPNSDNANAWAVKGTTLALTAAAEPAWLVGRVDGAFKAEGVLLLSGKADDGKQREIVAYPEGFDAPDQKTDHELAPVDTDREWTRCRLLDADKKPLQGAHAHEIATLATRTYAPAWMDFGIARTIHKAQGAQARFVVVLLDFAWLRGRKIQSEKYCQLLYTGASRTMDGGALSLMHPPPGTRADMLRALKPAVAEHVARELGTFKESDLRKGFDMPLFDPVEEAARAARAPWDEGGVRAESGPCYVDCIGKFKRGESCRCTRIRPGAGE